MKNSFGNNSPVLNLTKNNLKSKLDTQLLHGDNFKVIKKNKRKKIIIKKDGYKGFIKSKKNYNKANFKVCVLKQTYISLIQK